MSDCSSHKKEVAGISDMKVLAEMIGDLNYEKLSQLLKSMGNKLEFDANVDRINGREKLSTRLLLACYCIRAAQLSIEEAWKISKPFMNKK